MKVKSWDGTMITEPKVLGVYPRGDKQPHPPGRDSMGNKPKKDKHGRTCPHPDIKQ